MKKSTSKKTILGILLALTGMVKAQNPGLLISEFLQNPAGTDSPFEYVELIATDNIDFTITPYTVIVSNNGTATTDGWVSGGSLSYAFEITTGSVSTGDVVYVGGSSMAPTGAKLRTLDTGVDPGDGGIGSANTSGVFGNGGGNCDGIAVFNVAASTITNSTVPMDAVFYGTGVGSAEVNSGADGYQLPVNDLYNGGKLSSSSFVALDADLTIAFGQYDPTTNTWVTSRTFTTDNATDTSAIILGAFVPDFNLSFSVEEQTVSESAGTVTINLDINTSSPQSGGFKVNLVGVSNASNLNDFVLLDTNINILANATGTISFDVSIMDDVIEEQTEYLVFNLTNLSNATLSGASEVIIYISDNDRMIPTATNEVKLELLTSFSNGVEGSNSAEIVAYDDVSQRLFIANSIANNLDIVDFSNPSLPVVIQSINLDSIGGINSVAVMNSVVAVALENLNPQSNGYVVFFDTLGAWKNRLEAGAMPDMITFTHAGDKIIVANEGEPSDDYLTDPEGSISVIDLTNGITSLTASDVTSINFNAFDTQISTLQSSGVRIYGPGASVSQDFEPEYVTVLDDDSKAYISLQENNALAVVDLQTMTVTEIIPLGTIDHSIFGYGLDASNQTSGINIANFPIKGMFMPDAITHTNIGGVNYILTANEGDSRDYSGYSEEERVKDLILDVINFPNADELQSSLLLGRIKTTTANGDLDNSGDFEEIYTYGTRSFSIWDENGNLIFDSGDWFEQIISNDPAFAGLFNASNDPGVVEAKDRSDDKGPEPEGIAVAEFNGNYFAFVSLERVGGVMLFNINDPNNPVYAGYYNNRDVTTNGPDRGAEGLLIIEAAVSPTGNDLVILANEVSSTLSIYEAQSCQDLSGLVLSGSDNYCQGDSVNIVANTTSSVAYQWQMNSLDIAGETTNNLWVSTAGNYSLEFENLSEQCMGATDTFSVVENPLPMPTISISNGELVTQTFASYEWYYEGGAISGANNMTLEPQQNGDYEVLVTDVNGCTNTSPVYTVMFADVVSEDGIEFNMLPNPASGYTIFNTNSNEPVRISIYNLNGELIEMTQFKHQLMLDVSDLSEGAYLVQFTTPTSVVNTRLMIQH